MCCPAPARSFPTRPVGLACVVALLGSLLAAPTLAEGKKARRAKLDDINARWSGAEVTLKHPWKFKGKKNDGWYVSGVYMTSSARTFKSLTYRLRVREIEPLRNNIASGFLLAGTRFVAQGFEFRDENDEQGVYLDLRTANGDVPAEIVFFGRAGKPDLQAVEPIEQFLRLEVLDVRPPRERLVATTGSSGRTARPAGAAPFTLAPPPVAAPAPQPAPAEPAVFRPQLEILAVSVQPVSVAPGGSLQLIASYTVGGLPPGAAFEVLERRTLLAGESRLTTDEAPVPRSNGTFTSTQSARIPPAARPGVYRLDVELRIPGAEPVQASALFEVRP
jgi:hypothetical protein